MPTRCLIVRATLSVLVFGVCACAEVVTPGSALSSDGAPAPLDASASAPPPRCIASGERIAPRASFESVTANCEVSSVSCPSGRGIHVRAVDVRFPCGCTGGDPTIEARFDVTDDDAPPAQIALAANLMGCVHPGYRATGPAFSFTCGTGGGPRGQWAVLLTDAAGNSAWIGFEGPRACATTRYTCEPSTTPGAYPIVCRP